MDRLHAAGKRAKDAVGQLGEDRRHFEDTYAGLEDRRKLRPGPAARSRLCSFLSRPGALANLAGVQNADNVPTSPEIDSRLPTQLEQQTSA